MSPLGRNTKLVSSVIEMVGETSKHPVVRECLNLVRETAFSPGAIARVRVFASQSIIRTRQQYTVALRQNLHALVEGLIEPRQFVREFFELTESGNLRNDIRKKLVLSLLMSETVRPAIKFLILENFLRLPRSVRLGIVSEIVQAEPSRHVEVIKEELKWIIMQGRMAKALENR